GHATAAWRATERRPRLVAGAAAAGDLTVAALLLATGEVSVTWLIAVAAALRMFGIAWTIAVTPVHVADDAGRTVLDDLGLADRPEAAALLEQVVEEERRRAPSDRRWTLAFVATAFAVLGDMLLAILFTLAVLGPVVLSLRRSTRWIERRVWVWYTPVGRHGTSWPHRAATAWLRYRL